MPDVKEYPFEWHGRLQPDALSLDDFEVKTPSGATIRPHEGEVVWCKPYGATLGQSLSTVGTALDSWMEASKTASNEQIEAAAMEMAAAICDRSLGWTLTDPTTGEPYPQPSAGPRAVFDALPSPLFLWLFSRLAGLEDTTTRGNGSGASPGTSSARRVPKSRARRN
jgi:hypothetical protein